MRRARSLLGLLVKPRMRLYLAYTLISLASCAPPPPPPAAPPPEVAAGTASAQPTAALLDSYVGDYRSGAATMRVRHSGGGLILDVPAHGVVVLTLIGLDTFADAGGNSYLFATARDQSATRLAIIGADGTRSEWVR